MNRVPSPLLLRPAPALRRFAALLVLAVQAVAFLAPVAEERGGDFAPHVEQGGTQAHVAHSEDACPACATQLLAARLERGPRLGAFPALSTAAAIAAAVRPPARPAPTTQLSRAPPSQV